MMLTAYLFYSFFGYLSGSVLYSYLIPKSSATWMSEL